jgi:signal transduction histidine kinase/ligand-binding sensor domain-containing protein
LYKNYLPSLKATPTLNPEKTSLINYWAIIVCVVISSSTLHCQPQILVDRLSVKDGLSQSDIRCIAQDTFGFLWIGTRDGLNRFDGYSFEQFHFDNKDTSQLGFTQIHSLLPLPGGDIIVGSVGGFSIFDKDKATFRNVFFPEDEMRNAIVTDMLKDSTVVHLATSSGIRSYNLQEGGFVSNPVYEKFSNTNVTQLKKSKTHGDWIGTTSGLYVRLPDEEEFRLSFKDTAIHHLQLTPDEIFISTIQGLFHYLPKVTTFQPIRLLPGFRNVMSACRADNGEIWVASNQVLIVSADGSSVLHRLSHDPNNYRSLSEDRARILYETSDGIMWIGTFGYGLNKHDPWLRTIDYLGVSGDMPLSSGYVSCIYSPNDTVIFVGTSRGLNLIDRQKRTNTIFDPYAAIGLQRLFLVYAVKADSSGKVWMTGSGGLYSWRGNTFVYEKVNMSEILDFVEFDSSSLLLVTRISGCFMFDKNTKALTSFISKRGLPTDLQTVRIDGDDIWIGANDGLRKFNRQGEEVRHYTADTNKSTALPSNVIKSLQVDKDGVLWIGTWGGGLSQYDRGSDTFRTFTMNDGLPNNVVYGALEDQQERLWLSTNNGLSVFDRKKLLFNNFDARNGLQSNEFNTGAYFRSQYGRMYFGGVDGLSSFNPEEMLSAPKISRPFLTGATVGYGAKVSGQMRGNSGAIQLKWYENSITLHVSVVDFRNAHKYKLEYSVNGESWEKLGSARRLDLSELAPGAYVVRARTSIDNHTWTDAVQLITIEVSAPFWKHPIALTAIALATMITVFLGQRVRVKRLKNRNEMLDKIVQSRTREVQVKNEEILSQNEALQSQADELSRKNILLSQQKIELQAFQSELEQRVNEKTSDIQNLNLNLIKQNVQLEQFSFITAHNFKGPIARIKGLINLLSDPALSSEDFVQIREYLRVSIDDLDQVTQDLNTILHIKGTSREQLKTIDLQEVLKDVLSKLKNEIAASGVAVDIRGFANVRVLGMRAFIHSVLYNLLENAIKYRTTEATPTIIITCTQLPEVTTVEIADNGIGIDIALVEKKIFHIYQRFNYLPGSRGLGLFMVKTQMEMMGGQVTVESQLGKGTTFSLTFLKPQDN